MLDGVEPPGGTLWVVSASEPVPDREHAGAVPFVGWLGLLRALSEVTGTAGRSPHGSS